MNLWKQLRSAASTYDALPVSPSSVGERLLDVCVDRRQRRAAMSERWAEIEARRDLGRADGTKLLLSEDLTIADWEEQHQIEWELTPEGALEKTARLLRDLRVGRALGKVETYAQRSVRGWADEDVWNMSWYMTRQAGEMLLHLAENLHGWPCSETYPQVEDWERALREHGNVLVKRGWTQISEEAALDAWHEVGTGRDEDAAETARLLHQEQEAAAAERVRLSLQWIAENHQLLWD